MQIGDRVTVKPELGEVEISAETRRAFVRGRSLHVSMDGDDTASESSVKSFEVGLACQILVLRLHPRMDMVVSMSGNARPTLRLRTEKFDELAAAVTGARTDRELADKLGVSYNHLSQLRTHGRTPGTAFIAAVRTAMPHVPFEQLFETVEPVAAGDAA